MAYYTLKELFDKINRDIKEYGYVIFNMDVLSNAINNYSFDIEVSYNKNFSENIRFIVRNRIDSIIENFTINIKDLDYAFKKLEVL